MTIGAIFLMLMCAFFSLSTGIILSPARRFYTRILYALTSLGMVFALLAILVNLQLGGSYVTYEVFFGGLGMLYGAMQLWVIHLDRRIDKLYELIRKG